MTFTVVWHGPDIESGRHAERVEAESTDAAIKEILRRHPCALSAFVPSA